MLVADVAWRDCTPRHASPAASQRPSAHANTSSRTVLVALTYSRLSEQHSVEQVVTPKSPPESARGR